MATEIVYLVTVAYMLYELTAALQVCPLRLKVADVDSYDVCGCEHIGKGFDFYDTESCMRAAKAAGANAINLDRGTATCAIKSCNDLSDVPKSAVNEPKDLYILAANGRYKKIQDVTIGDKIVCTQIITVSTANTASECAQATKAHGGNAFNLNPPNACNFKLCSGGDPELITHAKNVYAAFVMTCMEISELVSTHGMGPFSTSTVLDGDDETCLDPATTTSDHTLTFSLPQVADRLMVLVVGEDISCTKEDYQVYHPTGHGPEHQRCLPHATNLIWETGSPVKCHFACECDIYGGCDQVTFKLRRPVEICELVIYMNEGRIVTRPNVVAP